VSVVPAGTSDTVRTPYFLSFGEDLPVAPFDEMISYLRFFASAQRLCVGCAMLAPEERAQMWSDFLRDTDPVPNTSEHEALQAYFARIQLANNRFREEIPFGWLSDRGNVFVALGEPDNAYEQTVTSSGGRRLPSPVRSAGVGIPSAPRADHVHRRAADGPLQVRPAQRDRVPDAAPARTGALRRTDVLAVALTAISGPPIYVPPTAGAGGAATARFHRRRQLEWPRER
jgi:GWxTD domain-containing protein